MQLLFICNVFHMQRICDNSTGVVNFCLFCLFTKEIRSATIAAMKRLCHRQSAKRIITALPEYSSLTLTRSSSGYGTINLRENDDSDNPIEPLAMLNDS